MSRFYEISLPIPQFKLFTYELDESINKADLKGCRALVPFGKRILTGVIMNETVEPKGITTKKIIEILDSKPVFNNHLLQLCEWLSEYYMVPIGETLKAALPQGLSPKSLIKVHSIRDISPKEIEEIAQKAPKRAALLKFLSGRNAPLSIGFIERELGSDYITPQITALEELGYISTERVMSKSVKDKIVSAVKIPDNILSDKQGIREILDKLDKIALKQSLIFSHLYLTQMQSDKPVPINVILKEIKTGRGTVQALAKKGYVEIVELTADRNTLQEYESFSCIDETNHNLTDEQNLALKNILDEIESDTKKPILLHGITGSGKTLLYMHSIKHILQKQQSALYIVPEISLTPQLIDRMRKSFGEQIALMHSRMSEGERYDSWKAIRSGKAKIALGARSAVFTPLENLGLIIIDEEHETSFKQDSLSPYYHARDVAIMRGKIENAAVILGSATPSIESMYNAINNKYKLLNIYNRADGAALPDIKIIDILNEKKNEQMIGNFSSQLIQAIEEKVSKKEAVILLQNRRGFSLFLECPDCGTIPECKYCSVTLTFHKKAGFLRCHYCGYSTPVHKLCSACGYPELKEIGSGTQKIEDELSNIIRERNLNPVIARLDLDSVSKKGSHRRILYDFAEGKIDILVGTQMVSKGLDFERVTLVGIVNADQQLYLPDFRAAEKTFQLITQTAGRAGRSPQKPGLVIVQTKHPADKIIDTASRGDYKEFFETELEQRKELNYPPFSRFIIIEFSSKEQKLVEEHARIFAKLFPTKSKYFILLGPASPTTYKIKNRYRKIIALKNLKSFDPGGKVIRVIILNAYNEYMQRYSKSSVRISIDIDSYKNI